MMYGDNKEEGYIPCTSSVVTTKFKQETIGTGTISFFGQRNFGRNFEKAHYKLCIFIKEQRAKVQPGTSSMKEASLSINTVRRSCEHL